MIHFHRFDVAGASYTRVSGINNRGDLVGEFENQSGVHGFLFDGKTTMTLDYPQAMSTKANGINDDGDIVGNFTDGEFRVHGFIYKGRQFTVVDAPFPDAGDTLLGGINLSGDMVGESLFQDAPTTALSNERGFLYQNEEFYPIPITRPSGINNRGKIVGDHFVYFDGVLTAISFPGATGTSVSGINDKGDLAGTYQLPEDPQIRGFLHVKKVFSAVEVPFADATGTMPTGININGAIVGFYFGDNNSVRGFVANP